MLVLAIELCVSYCNNLHMPTPCTAGIRTILAEFAAGLHSRTSGLMVVHFHECS